MPCGLSLPRIRKSRLPLPVVASEPSSPPSLHSASPEPISELVELGERLRRAREGRGIGVAELADRLHLSPEQLTALENGDRSHLQEPVFVIAQAKRVAQVLGVDVSLQVESLRHSRLLQPLSAPVPAVAPTPAPARLRARAAASLSRWPLVAATTALALLLGLVATKAYHLWSHPNRQARSAPAKATAPTPGGAPGVLRLQSDEPSWVEVRNSSGQVLFSGLLEKEARFRLGDGLRVLAGRPDLVTAAVGRDAPRRLGSISEVDWQDFAPPPATSPAPAP